ncbi:DNA (cytosine-5)-methyltransferase 1 [Saccharopolyspora shandongensis]|uniref:DNA (cytosine-5-)-methyltransferase n=1 Tax=Saccharopolyspora shandongensis TaxID=418495 RepID=A0A1H3LI39_9PSEU|nr:DNA cytosine methyltransferase [Saccharopolyspora shandongensis]SDY63515.1 DNA (cytosine-5)-methyltransferase 1 [Saccharopolyspora shandongensis]
MLTITDLFCGAGGSALGATAVPGLELRMAANHWQTAVDSHQANFPDADHACADISQVNVRRFPTTDLLWASPECTNHSIAQGRKRWEQPDLFGETLPLEAAERSRATMWDVPRFAESHHYRAIVVENVVDAVRWSMWPAWLHAMSCLGYRHQVVMLNSMHAPAVAAPRAPQSRDRLYVVFSREGDPVPEVTPRPLAWCQDCGRDVEAVQSWKKPDKPWGRYKAQYVYRCPRSECRRRIVEPYALPAAAAIDWTLQGQRIGDRTAPLKPATLRRIEAGLEKFAVMPQLVPAGGTWNLTSSPVDVPMRARTTRETEGLLVPVEGRTGKEARPASWPLRTQTTRLETALVVPYYRTGTARPTAEPLPTVTSHDRHGLAFIAELRGGGSTARPVRDPLATVTAAGNHHGLVEPQPAADVPPQRARVEDCRFRMLTPAEIQSAMAFRDDYQVLGTRREQVRQLGNAVTPPAAEFLLGAVARALGHTATTSKEAA